MWLINHQNKTCRQRNTLVSSMPKIKPSFSTKGRGYILIINVYEKCFTWHWAIFSGGCPPNIVAAYAFHSRVRDGSEWVHIAMNTRKTFSCSRYEPWELHRKIFFWKTKPVSIVRRRRRSSPRSISTPPLHLLPGFHVEPINGCSSRDLTGLCHGNTHLEVGFPLRCFQRLSTPHMATQRLPLAR